jgi:hypothetical protein
MEFRTAAEARTYTLRQCEQLLSDVRQIEKKLGELLASRKRRRELRAAAAANHNYAPPSPYAAGIKALREREFTAVRAAEATPEARFEQEYKAKRLRDLEAEWRRIGSWNS